MGKGFQELILGGGESFTLLISGEGRRVVNVSSLLVLQVLDAETSELSHYSRPLKPDDDAFITRSMPAGGQPSWIQVACPASAPCLTVAFAFLLAKCALHQA